MSTRRERAEALTGCGQRRAFCQAAPIQAIRSLVGEDDHAVLSGKQRGCLGSNRIAVTVASRCLDNPAKCLVRGYGRASKVFNAGSARGRSRSRLRATPRRSGLKARASDLACGRFDGWGDRWTANAVRPVCRGSYLASSNYLYGSYDSAASPKTILHQRANPVAIGPAHICNAAGVAFAAEMPC